MGMGATWVPRSQLHNCIIMGATSWVPHHGCHVSLYDFVIRTGAGKRHNVHPLGTLSDSWVDYPLYQVLEDFEVSLEEDPGTPGPRW